MDEALKKSTTAVERSVEPTCSTRLDQKAALWDAIHDYVRSCGGDPGRHIYGNTSRADAVIKIERIALGE